jgi:GT2 family glycosyltransferase
MALKSLRDQTFSDWSLYLYENSCSQDEADRVKDLLQTSGLKYSLTIGEKNLGFTTHNVLFSKHDAEFVFVMNDDAFLAPDYLAKLVESCDADKKCAAATGIVYRWSSWPELPAGPSAGSIIDTAGLEYACLANVHDRLAGAKRGDCLEVISREQEVFGVSASAALYRRSAVLEVSPDKILFDPAFFMYKEDVDLAIRLRRKGYAARFVPDAIAWHRRSVQEPERRKIGDRLRTERQRPTEMRLQTYRNQWLIYFYHKTIALGWRDLWRSFIFEYLRSALVFLASPSIFFSAWFRIFHDLPDALSRRRALLELGLKKTKLL